MPKRQGWSVTFPPVLPSAAELLRHDVLWASALSNPGPLTMPETPALRLIPLQYSQVRQMSRSPRSCMSVQSKSSGPS